MKVHLSVVEGPEKGRAFSFEESDRVVIVPGREPPAVATSDPTLSKHRILLEINPPNVYLQDTGSSGAYVNDSPDPVREAMLRHGDRIRGGNTVLLVEVDYSLPAGGQASEGESAHLQPLLAAASDTFSDAQMQWSVVRCGRCGLRALGEHSRSESDQVAYYCEPCQDAILDEPILPTGYRRVRELGRGGMGAVYLARHQRLGLFRALKVILPKGAISERMRKRFLREASEQAQLNHPHIVQVFDMQELMPGIFCMGMEYVPGEDAHAMLARTGWTGVQPEQAVQIIAQVLEGLSYAHQRGVVHRDVKDANFLLCRGPEGQLLAKLSDFGLAKSYLTAGTSKMTRTGETAGTIGYMAPEQITNFREARPSADIYSMGVALYRLLSGHLPHHFPPGVNEILIVLEHPIVPLRQRNPAVPARLAAVVERALAKKPEARFASAEEMRQAVLASL